jgi:hypothetical protein
VRAEVHLRAGEVRALADAGETRCEHLMSVRGQQRPDLPESMSAAPGSVHEDESCHDPAFRESVNRD